MEASGKYRDKSKFRLRIVSGAFSEFVDNYVTAAIAILMN